jgi:CheY-like chemotaxis protein
MSDSAANRPPVPVILVADDDEGVRTVIRRTLEEAGYAVLEAVDGLEALSLARQHQVDAVVTDIRMPRMDGWELAAQLRAVSPRAPILFISGFDVHAGTINLPGPVLAKPFRGGQLVDELSHLLVQPEPRSA